MDASNIALARKAVVEKLAQVPDDSIQAVLTFVDNLIEQRDKALTNQGAEPVTPPEEITTWAQWFQEIRDLPEIPSLANLTKKERQSIITEGLAEEYERQHLDVPSQNQ
jgi:hypothetical protein